ncbi:FKBP-type peptidyl-prolyl cis-trans isomerase [Microbacterium sp. ASV49]|uniref:Peptidylprolyl isomerase n=1 Tax=Microbacterium candidum TaxID=3041922 RepID=A0ABT7MZG1_9MICO|nr:hypothetical protein [Microbacterium sp. ASV49]MDL9979843.1 hypothetical protein [Microbacterium sp. ASV49]
MRTLSALLAVVGLSALALTGCSSGTAASSCPSPTSSGSAASLIQVSGDVGSAPTVTIATPFHTSENSWTTLVQGSGTPITADDQLVVLGVTFARGNDGKTVNSAYGAQAPVQPVSYWTQLFPGLRKALQCATPGSRVAVALPPSGYAPGVVSGLGPKDSGALVVDVQKVYLTKADGADQYNAGFGLPTVVRTDTGRPGVIVPDGSAPTDVVVQTLKKGDGEKVTGTDPVRIHALEVTWDDKKVVNTTWDGEPQSVDLSTLSPDLGDALKDKTVGSQLMIVVPAGQDTDNTGDTKQAHVYVIDILGIDPASSTNG